MHASSALNLFYIELPDNCIYLNQNWVIFSCILLEIINNTLLFTEKFFSIEVYLSNKKTYNWLHASESRRLVRRSCIAFSQMFLLLYCGFYFIPTLDSDLRENDTLLLLCITVCWLSRMDFHSIKEVFLWEGVT